MFFILLPQNFKNDSLLPREILRGRVLETAAVDHPGRLRKKIISRLELT